MGIDFVHFGLESGMVFEGLHKCMNVFVISVPEECERKSNLQI